MPAHICPVCGTLHQVTPGVHRFAYGRQLTCSPRCKAAFSHQVRRRILAELARRLTPANKDQT